MNEKKFLLQELLFMTLLTTIREKIIERRQYFIFQSNAPAHRLLIVLQTIWDFGFQILKHPAYFIDLASSDFYVLPQLKKNLEVRKFYSNEELIEAEEAWYAEQDTIF